MDHLQFFDRSLVLLLKISLSNKSKPFKQTENSTLNFFILTRSLQKISCCINCILKMFMSLKKKKKVFFITITLTNFLNLNLSSSLSHPPAVLCELFVCVDVVNNLRIKCYGVKFVMGILVFKENFFEFFRN